MRDIWFYRHVIYTVAYLIHHNDERIETCILNCLLLNYLIVKMSQLKEDYLQALGLFTL